jgi:oxaloacetate decarboxylase alpha subunit/acetyl-CoA carboxylase biotin carboxyl carrier protein
LDIKDIKTIIELMKRNDLAHFELERDGQKLVLKKGLDSDSLSALASQLRAAGSVVSGGPPPPAAAGGSPTAAAGETNGNPGSGEGEITIKSPMVGTFYRAAGPDQEPYSKVGDYVEADTTVCIIEAMKVMNEIKAEVSGRIVRIAVEDGTPVGYGQVLFEVKR